MHAWRCIVREEGDCSAASFLPPGPLPRTCGFATYVKALGISSMSWPPQEKTPTTIKAAPLLRTSATSISMVSRTSPPLSKAPDRILPYQSPLCLHPPNSSRSCAQSRWQAKHKLTLDRESCAFTRKRCLAWIQACTCKPTNCCILSQSLSE